MTQTSKRGKRRNYTKLRQAAWVFTTRTRHPAEIGRAIGVTPRTITEYATDPLWHSTLDALGYIGDRSFTKKSTRSTTETEHANYKYAEYVYRHIMGIADFHKRDFARLTEVLTQIPRQKIRRWARQKNWLDLGRHETTYFEDELSAHAVYQEEKYIYKYPQEADAQMPMMIALLRDVCGNPPPNADETQVCLFYTAKRTRLPYQQIKKWQEENAW